MPRRIADISTLTKTEGLFAATAVSSRGSIEACLSIEAGAFHGYGGFPVAARVDESADTASQAISRGRARTACTLHIAHCLMTAHDRS
jgi:hypothetical protein